MSDQWMKMAIVPVDRIIGLRHRVLREGLPIETAHFTGDDDLVTQHFATFLTNQRGEEGQVICCATFMPSNMDDELAWRLRGMATAPEYQGSGIGQRLLAWAEEVLVQKSVSGLFWCDARVRAIPFYERSGWYCITDVFEIPGVGPHRKMMKRYRLGTPVILGS